MIDNDLKIENLDYLYYKINEITNCNQIKNYIEDKWNLKKEIKKDNFSGFIKKCYGKCINDKEKLIMKEILKNIYNKFSKKENFDWDSIPMPLLPREKKKNIVNLSEQKNNKKLNKKNKSNINNNLKIKNEILENDNDKNEIEKIRIGTNTELEKKYLRITEFVDFTKVRPENILKESLKFVINKYLDNIENSEYLLDQLRSIRQDLLVQHIRNEFTVKVYEFSVKFSLIFCNLEQYNLSNKELIQMYSEGIQGNKIYYYYFWIIFLTLNSSYSELNSFLNNLPAELLNHKKIKKALKFKKDLSQGNFNLVFSYIKNKKKSSPLKGLLKCFIDKLRVWKLKLISNYYFGNYLLANLQNDLLFKDNENMIKFLKISSNLNRSNL